MLELIKQRLIDLEVDLEKVRLRGHYGTSFHRWTLIWLNDNMIWHNKLMSYEVPIAWYKRRAQLLDSSWRDYV